MYGYLRPEMASLNNEEVSRYTQHYCTTCCALNDIFGLSQRLLTSYDAAFIGILFSSQNQNTENTYNNFCTYFKGKEKSFDSNELVSKISASIAILIGYGKLLDHLQDRPSAINELRKKGLKRSYKKALNILHGIGFETEKYFQLFNNQFGVEKSKNISINDLCDPTATFIGALIKFTATINNEDENEDLMYQIGYNIGKIIYIVDACVDIVEDINKDQFNYLISVLKDDNKQSQLKASNETVEIICESFRKIRACLERTKFKRNERIIKNILTIGFPLLIIKELTRTIKLVDASQIKFPKYLPHVAIITGLCILIPETGYSKWVWNYTIPDNSTNWIAYGFTCCAQDKYANPSTDCCTACYLGGTYIDCLCNPFVYFDTWSSSSLVGKGGICFQIPKSLIYLYPLSWCQSGKTSYEGSSGSYSDDDSSNGNSEDSHEGKNENTRGKGYESNEGKGWNILPTNEESNRNDTKNENDLPNYADCASCKHKTMQIDGFFWCDENNKEVDSDYVCERWAD